MSDFEVIIYEKKTTRVYDPHRPKALNAYNIKMRTSCLRLKCGQLTTLKLRS